MRISRIFHPDLLSVDEHVTLGDDATNHLANVLRAKVGQPLILFNGDGAEYSAHVVDITKRKVIVCIDTKLSLSVESPLKLHLGQGISRGDRMDWVIQKAVELGVSEISPLITERCGVKLSAERWLKKHEQWQKLIISACEQCGRNTLPTLHTPIDFHQWISQSTEQLRLTLHPRAESTFRHIRLPVSGVRLLIGPEGGFSDQEIYQTEQSGFHTIQMGPRVLRTETAAIAAIAALQAIHGDL
ncbi:MAG: 16S rRNA (uracil(1498)-N(3))-methyltransferase [Paraglaciecola sp.]|uniref:16S rRNA (uracil(1498)-N(3))-methyltransferase n=1 Tax=Pseudomonadati TaxID=3379134 RepID=UPI00273D42FC|nr:16S rRNA (uracil(1498)-N(3))-methyltransferase [Paraglaciecola sp.]MDP5029317.1 16S rRNA (uracil(1498)-N(3))-methyltransferase [Paraglaciecola sp.]MDP5133432.1 16S rRNA (uracil(1498)-N(3))-methyltransferase [Paraglaciecola sp.]